MSSKCCFQNFDFLLRQLYKFTELNNNPDKIKYTIGRVKQIWLNFTMNHSLWLIASFLWIKCRFYDKNSKKFISYQIQVASIDKRRQFLWFTLENSNQNPTFHCNLSSLEIEINCQENIDDWTFIVFPFIRVLID